MATVPEERFREMVARDAHGRLDDDAAEALRHPVNRKRWSDMLKLLLVDVNNQFAQNRGDYSPETAAWRRKAVRWQESACGTRLARRRYGA